MFAPQCSVSQDSPAAAAPMATQLVAPFPRTTEQVWRAEQAVGDRSWHWLGGLIGMQTGTVVWVAAVVDWMSQNSLPAHSASPEQQ